MTTTSAGKPGSWITYRDLKIGHELNDGGVVTAIRITAKRIKVTAEKDGRTYTFTDRNNCNVLVAGNDPAAFDPEAPRKAQPVDAELAAIRAMPLGPDRYKALMQYNASHR